MKLVIVTVVNDYINDVFNLFRISGITMFSKFDIEGFKTAQPDDLTFNWFASVSAGADSEMFFSFVEDAQVDMLFNEIKAFNEKLTSNNPVKAIVVPIERSI